MKSIELEPFVHDSLAAIGAVENEISPGTGIWSAEFPTDGAKQASRFLGRGQQNLLYTFDLARWEEGARLECLSPSAQLTRRLQAYAAGMGALALAHVPVGGNQTNYCAYLLTYFGARHVTDTVAEHHKWLGADIETGTAVKIKGDPLATPNLVEGPPPHIDSPPTLEQLAVALQGLADSWNAEVAQISREMQIEIERKFHLEAAEVISSKQGDEQKVHLARLQQRLQLKVESQAHIALLLWLPQKQPS